MMNLRPVDLADMTPYQMGAAYEMGKALAGVR